MRILADSNVFIDFWKKPTQSVIDTFASHDVVICGIVKAELIHGAKTDANKKKITDTLGVFESLSFEETDWTELGNLLYLLRTNGITVPFQDAIIALLAVKHNIQLWTNDNHFRYMQRIMKDLQLFEG